MTKSIYTSNIYRAIKSKWETLSYWGSPHSRSHSTPSFKKRLSIWKQTKWYYTYYSILFKDQVLAQNIRVSKCGELYVYVFSFLIFFLVFRRSAENADPCWTTPDRLCACETVNERAVDTARQWLHYIVKRIQRSWIDVSLYLEDSVPDQKQTDE